MYFHGFSLHINPSESEVVQGIKMTKLTGTTLSPTSFLKQNHCYWPIVKSPGWTRLQLEYNGDQKTVSVAVYDPDDDTFESCFVLEAALDFAGYFVIAGYSGDEAPFEITLDSFKLFDPTVQVRSSYSNHF